jgi:hypothetical protein
MGVFEAAQFETALSAGNFRTLVGIRNKKKPTQAGF